MKSIITLLCLAACLWQTESFAQKNYPVLIDRYMQAQVAVNEFSGVVLVANKGSIIYKKAFGYADREWKMQNTVETKFEIGSLTKQFTAAAILQLAEQGKLKLDDRLSSYFPGYPKADSITVHMLLTHTSGIADYTGLPAFYPLHTLSLAKDSIINLFKNQPFNFSPGTNWSYSNSGYFLLGCIIEKVSGQPYSAYLHNNIINKAGLANTGVNRIDSILALRAKGYSRQEKGGWKNADYFSMEFPFSAGALIATVDDLYRWQTSLQAGNIVSTGMLSKMTTPYRNNYGYGLFIDSFEHQRRVWHNGAIPGFTSYLCGFAAGGITIAVLSNDDGNTDAVGDAVTAILFNLPADIPYKHVEHAINTAVLKRYPGRYQLGGTMNLAIIEKDSKLFIQPDGGPLLELKPESETKFFFARDPEQQIEFILDNKKMVTKIYFINKGSKIEIKKL